MKHLVLASFLFSAVILPSGAVAQEFMPVFAANTAPFPASPMTSEQQMQQIVRTGGVSAGSQLPHPTIVTEPQQGVAPLPPLTPPDRAVSVLEKIIAPFSGDSVRKAKELVEEQREAVAYRPVTHVPRTRSLSVDLSPGSELPVLYTAMGEISTMVFIDSSGAPWPLATPPRVSNPQVYEVEWIKDTPSIMVSSMSSYESGNLTVFLQGLATPVLVRLDHASVRNQKRVVDYRLDLRIPGRGPHAASPMFGGNKISLYDNVMQRFLDGIPPEGAKVVKTSGKESAKGTRIWNYQGSLFVRTPLHIHSAFDQSMSSSDGMKLYRLPPTPYVTLSDMGAPVTLELDIVN